MTENRDRYLWLLVVMAALGVGLPTFVRSGTPASAGPSVATEQASESRPAQQAATDAESTDLSRSFFRPLEAMLACEQAPSAQDLKDGDLGSWVDRCRPGDHAGQREAIVAIVPDPLDSMHEHMFDRLLEAINRAAGDAGYVRDRYYLPWQSDLATPRRDNRTRPPTATHEHETTPGLLLFRSECHAQPPAGPCKPGFLAVLLVGETSAWGVHHRVLQRALMMADTLETGAGTRRLRILGPTFSGSVSSLHSALERYPYAHPVPPMKHTGFDVVTGEATNAANTEIMMEPDLARRPNHEPFITYHATVTDDNETLQRFYYWLATTMDLHLKQDAACPCTLEGVGVLTETDTVYARGFAQSRCDKPTEPQPTSLLACKGENGGPRLRPELVVRYPSRVAHLRSIYERTRRNKASATQLPIEDPRRMLDLSLVDSDEAVEAVPEFSDKTQFSDELVFTGSLKAMCRSDLRFLGIISVDSVNRLFVAREARRYCANLRLFTLESDVLYAHPDVADDMNGNLIVSPYPLFPQNGAWTLATVRGVIAPFGDSAAQGTYNAALQLLGKKDREVFESLSPPSQEPPIDNALPVWVSAAGNGTLWPVAMKPPNDDQRPRSESMAPGTDAASAKQAADERADRTSVHSGPWMASRPVAPGAKQAAGDEATRMLATGTFVHAGQWRWAFGAIWLACTVLAAGYWLGRYAPRLHIVGLGAFRVFRPVDSAAAEHALFSALALIPVTCAYVAAAGFVLIEHILSHPFDGTLLDALRTACSDGPRLCVPAVMTGLLLIAASADAVIAPLAAEVAVKLRGRALETALHGAGLLAAGIGFVTYLARTPGLVFEQPEWIMMRERAINASSGLSPLVPASVFSAAAFIAARMQLARMQHRVACRIADPMAVCDHAAVEGMPALRDRTLAAIDRFGGGFWTGALLTAVIIAWWLGGIPTAMTTLEGPVWNWPLTLTALAGLVLALASYIPFVLGCHRLRDYLRRHANLPCVEAFSRLPGRAARKMSAILVQPPPVVEMERAVQQLRLLSSQVRSTRLHIDEELRTKLHGALSAASTIEDALKTELDPAAHPVRPDEAACTAQQMLHDVAATLARVVASQWERPASREELAATSAALRKLAPDYDLPTTELYRRAGDDETRVWLRLAEEFVATQSATFFHEVLHTLRRLLTTATVAVLLLLAGVSSYPFERRPMLLFIMQGVVVMMVIGTVAILSSMEKSEVLGRICKIDGTGKVTWNRSFIVRIAIYGILPIVSVVATQLPSVAGALFGWVPALLGVMQ
jgi:hypothetical protein